jgi:hypothetical protein
MFWRFTTTYLLRQDKEKSLEGGLSILNIAINQYVILSGISQQYYHGSVA